MDQVIRTIAGVGEVGIDTEASPGNGSFYVKHYASGYDSVGFSSLDEAWDELQFMVDNQSQIAV